MHEPRARIYTIVAMIPSGSVATYGQIAQLAGLGRQARQVGYALAALDVDSALPWHRVVNARGEISQRARAGAEQRQRSLLEQEGVRFDDRGRISLGEFGWRP
jgi:methylated-DNA-protein-cysteine methyltransferase-like protein